MTLDQLIKQYKVEEYNFWKYRDKDGTDINIRFFFRTHSEYLERYLGFYRNLPNPTELIIYATEGVFKVISGNSEYFIRHNHQEVFQDKYGNNRGVPLETSKLVGEKLFLKIDDILKAKTFDEIFEIVLKCKVKGFGELSIYDTAIRISSYRNLEPDKIYLHAGARHGMEALERKGYVERGSSKMKYVEIKDMPKAIKQLSATEASHMFCSMKEMINRLEPKKSEEIES